MEKVFPVRKVWYYLILVWTLTGLATHFSAILWMIQYDEKISLYRIIDLGFYYYIPVILWIIYTPFIIRWYQKRPLSGNAWKRNLLLHFLISLAFAPISRILAIAFDFSIKYLLGMGTELPWEVVYQARFIVMGSAPWAFLSYWIVIGAVIVWQYFAIRKQANTTPDASKSSIKQIFVPHNASKKRIAVEDIYWIEANRNYVHIHTSDQHYKLRQSLISLLNELDKKQFLQIHRSKIINKSAIESLSHWRRGEYLIRLKNNKLLGSSRTYLQNIKEILAD